MNYGRSQSPETRDNLEECFNCHSVCLVTLEYGLEKSGRFADPDLLRILRDCAEICQTHANFLLGNSVFAGDTAEVCAEVCDEAARSCEALGDDTQMVACAHVCHAAAEACRMTTGARKKMAA